MDGSTCSKSSAGAGEGGINCSWSNSCQSNPAYLVVIPAHDRRFEFSRKLAAWKTQPNHSTRLESAFHAWIYFDAGANTKSGLTTAQVQHAYSQHQLSNLDGIALLVPLSLQGFPATLLKNRK